MTKAERNTNDETRIGRRSVGVVLVLCSLALMCDDGEHKAFGQLPLPKKAGASSNATNQTVVPGGNQTPAMSVQSIEAKLAEVRAKLAAAEEQGDAGLTNAPAGVSPQDITLR